MKVMLVGGSGGLGKLVAPLLEDLGHEVTSLSSKDIDLAGPINIDSKVAEGAPEVLINMATVSIDSLIGKLTLEGAYKQIEVNVKGGLWLMYAFSRHCKEKSIPGRYIYISSILSDRAAAGAGVYAACKAFNDSLIKTAAVENARYGITFNSIQLGYFGAGLCDKLPEKLKEKVLGEIPLKRWGAPKELVNLIQYFINTEYATGTNVKLAGGWGA